MYDRCKGTFRSWLFTVTRNASPPFTKLKAHAASQWRFAVQEWLEGRPAEDEESAAWDREYQERLLAYAAELARPFFEESTWQAFWQTAVEGAPGKDVAHKLGMTVAPFILPRAASSPGSRNKYDCLLMNDLGENSHVEYSLVSRSRRLAAVPGWRVIARGTAVAGGAPRRVCSVPG